MASPVPIRHPILNGQPISGGRSLRIPGAQQMALTIRYLGSGNIGDHAELYVGPAESKQGIPRGLVRRAGGDGVQLWDAAPVDRFINWLCGHCFDRLRAMTASDPVASAAEAYVRRALDIAQDHCPGPQDKAIEYPPGQWREEPFEHPTLRRFRIVPRVWSAMELCQEREFGNAATMSFLSGRPSARR
jgi:hypothetical protein